MEDAVLRVLVDKYKPLRGGTIRTAEEKLKQTPPSIHLETTGANIASTNWANEPILPAVDGHKPWLTTYEVPSHATTSIRVGNFPSPVSSRPPSASPPIDDRTRRKEKEVKKRTEVAGRLTRAKESTLDYRLGVNNSDVAKQTRPNPVSLRGWTSLIEDKIEVCACAGIRPLMVYILVQKARNAGLFNKVPGRGRPLVRQIDESNPFIGDVQFITAS
jgi:DnaJ family protein C protein 28